MKNIFSVVVKSDESNSCYCIHCAMTTDHVTQKCDKFSIADKKEKLKHQDCCFTCLSRKYLAKHCISKKRRVICWYKHDVSFCYNLFEDGRMNGNIHEKLITDKGNNTLVVRLDLIICLIWERPVKENFLQNHYQWSKMSAIKEFNCHHWFWHSLNYTNKLCTKVF